MCAERFLIISGMREWEREESVEDGNRDRKGMKRGRRIDVNEREKKE